MHSSSLTLKRLILICGDTFVFYAALIAALLLRYGWTWQEALESHLAPFSIVLAFGIFIFYAMRLYDVVAGHGRISWVENTLTALALHFFSAVFFFYFFAREAYAITPRGTLFLFFAVFSFMLLLWRKSARAFIQRKFREPALILGGGRVVEKLAEWFIRNPEAGYEVKRVVTDKNLSAESLHKIVRESGITTIIASKEMLEALAPQLLRLADLKVNFWDLAFFYETQLEKIPLEYTNDAWVLQHIVRRETPTSVFIKPFLDRIAAGICIAFTLPLWPILALLAKAGSRGPVFYAQTRAGQEGKTFTLKKFRTMYADAEASGAQWAAANDPRITPIGKILRRTHLDELPQLLNILSGEMSFVGPRPERPEFVTQLAEKIPHYNVRHLIKPGFTGWAQLNYPYGASIEDAEEKLQYDLYYLKHRSLLLDISILLKTLRLFFHNPQK